VVGCVFGEVSALACDRAAERRVLPYTRGSVEWAKKNSEKFTVA
jgi:hypothetical protein